MAETTYPVGTAPVKAEYAHCSERTIFAKLTSIYRYILHIDSRPAPDDDAAESSTKRGEGNGQLDDGRDQSRGGPQRKKLSKEAKRAQRGANKGRKFGKVRDDLELCWRIGGGGICEFGEE
jgi:tRNA-dihydrouridine synthase 3